MKKYIDLFDMANMNCSNVLGIIRKKGPVSRKEITELSGLSWGGMTKIVNKLLENGYIVEEKLSDKGTSGRTPSILSVNTSRNFVVGLDINKIGFRAVVMNLKGEVLKAYKGDTSADTAHGFMKEIIGFIKNIFADFHEDSIISIAIAMQGLVDAKNGISVKFPYIADWENIPVKYILEEKFGAGVFLEHDPDCHLYSYMENKKRENIVLLRIDRSVGMAVSVGGKIISGAGVFEIAHNIVIPNGVKCRCGRHGCLEAYIRPCTEKGKPIPEKIESMIHPLAISIINLEGMFNAQKIVLAGDLVNHSDLFEERLFSDLEKLGFGGKIEFSKADDREVTGAALIAIKKSIDSLMI